MYYMRNGNQMAPCIAAKVKHALGVLNNPNNRKTCGQEYWYEACEIIGIDLNRSKLEIESAKKKMPDYMRL